MTASGRRVAKPPGRVLVTETIVSTWLRGLRDHRSYLVPVGCTWHLSHAAPRYSWGRSVRLRSPLTWKATEEDFRRAVIIEAGRYYLKALAPNGRPYHDNGLAYFDVVRAVTEDSRDVRPLRPIPATVLAALRARQV